MLSRLRSLLDTVSRCITRRAQRTADRLATVRRLRAMRKHDAQDRAAWRAARIRAGFRPVV